MKFLILIAIKILELAFIVSYKLFKIVAGFLGSVALTAWHFEVRKASLEDEFEKDYFVIFVFDEVFEDVRAYKTFKDFLLDNYVVLNKDEDTGELYESSKGNRFLEW